MHDTFQTSTKLEHNVVSCNNTITVTTRIQSCKYCPLWAQGGLHDFKMGL